MPKQGKKGVVGAVPALKVGQWLDGWEAVRWDEASHRRKPLPHFYIFSLSARQLRALSGVNRRELRPGKMRSEDTGIQRSHEPSRSENIARYVKFGYPWSDLTDGQRRDSKFNDLQKPGWLPTAIVVNILTKDDRRRGKKVDPKDLVTVIDTGKTHAEIKLPKSLKISGEPPIEVIDGQHRLLAFDESIEDDYELPVVAFYGLDISWQAYLFWTINIKPKRINPSLAFDLYPLLRTEEWLERFEGHRVYREARAQELVEILWSEPKTAWHQRINMLGESGGPSVTQAAWVRALLKTFIKSSEGKGVSVGGLYGAPAGQDQTTIPWNRSQQAALLIYVWNSLRDSVKKNNGHWAKELRNLKKQGYSKPADGDPAFAGSRTMLNNDQGVSVVLNVVNDLLYTQRENLKLQEWVLDAEVDTRVALTNLQDTQKDLARFIRNLAVALAKFDWRSSGAIGLNDDERTRKLTFRGGSGYKEFRRQLLRHLISTKDFGHVAKILYEKLGFADEDAKNAE